MTSRARNSKWIMPALVAAVALAASTSWAGITPTGDISPTPITSWTASTVGYIGNTSAGTVLVNAGSKLLSSSGYLGYASGATGTVTVDGTSSAWADSSSLWLGYSGAGTLSLTNGGTVNSLNSYLGYNTGATGTATIDGTGSKWTNSTLYVGNSGTGTLSLTNGGRISSSTAYVGSSSGATGLVSIDGTGSAWVDSGSLSVGYSGAGTLSLTNGGTVNSLNSYLGYNTGATGIATIDGTGSKWTNSSLYVGNSGIGTMTITRGGTVTSSSGYLGGNSGSTGTVTVDGAGSAWANSFSLYVGYSDAGTMNITNGGTVSSSSGYLGYYSGATGTATVDGAGSAWANSFSLYVGYSGAGTLTITNAGTVTSSSFGSLGFQSGSTGAVLVNGIGSMWKSYSLFVGYSGTGTLAITNAGTVTNSSTGYVGHTSGSMGAVTVDGTGSMWANTSLYIGNYGSGTLNITSGGSVHDLFGDYIGNHIGSSGMVTVDGIGSTWANGGLVIGNSGAGTLNVTNGGLVNVAGTTTLAANSGATGSINFGANGGTLTTQSLYARPAYFTGTGTVNTHGLVSDLDLAVDATHGLNQTLAWISAGQNVTVNLDMSGAGGTVGDLGAGYAGTGTLAIRDGMTITSANGYLGYQDGATGIATVDGAGSIWTVNSAGQGGLFVGYSGTGTLNITNGGIVKVAGATTLAANSGASGSISFGSNGGTLTTQSLSALPAQMSGTGTINANGLLSDGDLVFDATHGLAQLFHWNAANQNVTVNLDMTGTANGALGAGFQDTGTLAIRDGVSVTSGGGYLGSKAGSTGVATVSGIGSTWTSNGNLYVGNSGTGTLNITHGGQVSVNAIGYLGYNGTGTVSVDGAGSKWTNLGDLDVGYYGSGALAITGGGNVTSPGSSYLGHEAGSQGTAAVDGAGSVWNDFRINVGLYGMGTLNITNGGAVNSSSNSYIGCYFDVTGTVNVDGLGSAWTNKGPLYLGYYANGVLRITNGGKVTCNSTTYLAYNTLATATVTVDGAGSTWACNGIIFGYYSSTTGTLNITNGAHVNCSGSSYLGYSMSSKAVVAVDGSGSMWTNSGTLYLGFDNYASATLNITNGGIVTANGASITYNSLMALAVGNGSKFDCGTGNLTNSGIIRLKAAPGLAPGIYTPITAASWSGSGTTQALGGSWSSTSHAFIVSAPANGTTGQAVAINLLQTQRVVITDPTANKIVEAGFQGTTTTSNLTMSALTLTSAQTALLQNTLPANESILTGWTFTTAGYTTGNPVFLSLAIGPGYAANYLALWHYDGTTWTPYTPTDLSYDGTYANFTVTGFSGYAVAAVPEPGSLALLALGGVGLWVRRRRHAGSDGGGDGGLWAMRLTCEDR